MLFLTGNDKTWKAVHVLFLQHQINTAHVWHGGFSHVRSSLTLTEVYQTSTCFCKHQAQWIFHATTSAFPCSFSSVWWCEFQHICEGTVRCLSGFKSHAVVNLLADGASCSPVSIETEVIYGSISMSAQLDAKVSTCYAWQQTADTAFGSAAWQMVGCSACEWVVYLNKQSHKAALM